MISNTIIQKTMEEMALVTKAGYALFDDSAKAVMSTSLAKSVDTQDILSFIDSGEDHKQIDDSFFFRVMDEDECAYILVANSESDTYTMGKVAVCQLQNLMIAYKDRTDRNNFFQNLIMDMNAQVQFKDAFIISIGEKFNLAEMINKKYSLIPSVAFLFKFSFDVKNNEYLESHSWSQSEMTVSAGYKNLYKTVHAISAGVDVDLGMADTEAPKIVVWDDKE